MKTKLKNRTIDNGVVTYTEQGLIDYLLRFGKFDPLLFTESDETRQFNALQKKFDTQRELVNAIPEVTDDWFVPEEYLNFDVEKQLLSQCDTQEEIDRVKEELEMFRERDMENMLAVMMYLVDFMEENDIVWGVGRGSSVASYCLYLLKVHDINSLEHDIPITEFLR